ncbi:hypothetical protein LINPERPRIM_LOCUS3883 [Linum perenne]
MLVTVAIRLLLGLRRFWMLIWLMPLIDSLRSSVTLLQLVSQDGWLAIPARVLSIKISRTVLQV